MSIIDWLRVDGVDGVDGVDMTTDGLGQLAINGRDAATTIEIVGRKASPMLEQVAFTQ